ncbi:MAG: hypothetical protein JXR63_13300, partial [Spirochaetales bacterium]|nr:hypothetical protein [Spirochaetales bacterium]
LIMIKKHILFVILLNSLVCFSLNAQFRTGRNFAEGDIITTVDLNQNEQVTTKFKIYDYVMILPLKDTNFIEEIEISFSFADDLFYHIENFLLCSYSNLNIDYNLEAPFHFYSEGSRIYYSLLQKNRKVFLKLPLIDGKRDLNSPDTLYPAGLTNKEDFPIIFTIAPAMKGLPDFLKDSEIEVTVTKKIAPISFLKIKIPEIETKEAELKINNIVAKFSSDYIKVEPGSNLIWVKIPGYEPIEQIVNLKSGEKKEIILNLTKIIPSILIEAPENAEVYFNGKKVDQKKFKVEIGTHTILFILDGYKVSKQIEITENREYKVSLFLKISVD